MEKNSEGEELAKNEPLANSIANKEEPPWPESLGFTKPAIQYFYNKEKRHFDVDFAQYVTGSNGNLIGRFIRVKDLSHFRECVRCKKRFPIKSCPNCGGTELIIDDDFVDGDKILCDSCRKVFFRWSCPSCNTDNSFPHTLGKYYDSKICFIVTACTGYNSWEVKILSSFRDEILQGLPKGLVFINLYYKYAPRLADKISQKPLMLKFFKYLIVQPVAFIISLLFIRRLNKTVI